MKTKLNYLSKFTALLIIVLFFSGCQDKGKAKENYCENKDIQKVVCEHYCLLKNDGKSNFKNTHVHICGRDGKFDPKEGITGVGHDDETPGMKNPTDEHHQSESDGSSTSFDPSSTGLQSPTSRGYEELVQIYYHPKKMNKDGKCPDEWMMVVCDACTDTICICCSNKIYQTWFDGLEKK